MISQHEWPAQGEYVDFRDKDNNPWQVGYVLLKAKNVLKVRSEGWSSKFDELIQLNNARIKPFRSVVRGYTGQVKNPALREHWRFSAQAQEEATVRWRQFVEQLGSKEENEIRQFLRGSHYFWIDFLLTVTYASAEEMRLSYEYLKQHIKFTQKYLEEISAVGIAEWTQEDASLPERTRAYRESYYEIMDALYLLTGINLRQLSFQKNNDKIIREATDENTTHDRYITRFMSEVGLDDTYLKLLAQLEKQTFLDAKVIPIPFLYQFFHIFAPIEKALLQKTDPPFDALLTNKQQRKKITLRLFNIIKKQIQYLSPAQLKLFQVEKEIESLLAETKAIFYKYGLEQVTFEWIERVRLRISFLLIQSDTLERKLKGILKLKDIYETLITVNELNPYRLKPQDFTEFIAQQRVVEELFEKNEHPEILKKGGEICQLLLKSAFIPIDAVIAIWGVCSHKHDAVRKVIYQLWNDLIEHVPVASLANFTDPIFQSCQKGNEGEVELFVEEWEAEMLFSFVATLVKHYQEQLEGREQVDAIIGRFIDLEYEKLIFFENSGQIKNLIGCFAKLVNLTTLCNKVVKESYQSIAKSHHLRINIDLLITVYQQSFQKSTYLPANAIQVVFLAFQSPDSRALSQLIFQLMDEIINFSNNVAGHYILTQQEFESLWRVAQENEAVRGQFYSWLVKKNSDGLFGMPLYEISQSIPHDLKSIIFKNFLCDYSKFDYFNLTLEELQIFKEFLIFENDQENRIEIRRLMSLMKIVRVKSAETVGNKYMWDIFLNCKNEEVIRQLSRIILVFHFNYHDALEFKARKARVVSLLVKLEKHIKDGFKKGNLKLMKHSLILLKDVIDFVKEKRQPREAMQNYQQYFKTTIKVLFETKKHDLEIFFGVTYYEIKSKIAEIIKLDRTKFQMFSLKNEEISLQFAEVPFCFMQEKTIKVIRILDDEETIPNTVLNFVKDRIESTLIDMLEDETICENVYKVLEEIEIKVDEGEFLLDKLRNIIGKHEQQGKGEFSKYETYLNLFYLRILHFMMERPHFLEKFIKARHIIALIERLAVPVNSPLTVVYLFHCIDIINVVLKKLKSQSSEEIHEIMGGLRDTLKEKCMRTLSELCLYINQTSGAVDDKAHNTKKVRIVFNCLNIIEELSAPERAVLEIVNHDHFSLIARRIYLSDSMYEIRLIFAEKLKKLLQKFRESVAASKEPEGVQAYSQLINKISQIFIRELYYEIKEKDGVYANHKKVQHFYKFIGFIVSLMTEPEFVDYVRGGNGGPHFYEDLLKNTRLLSDSAEATATPNYLLSAHLNILTAVYQKQPSLLDEDMLHYLLYDCLFFSKNESHQLDVACKKQETIKAALDVVQAGVSECSSAKFMKIIREVQEFHRIEYWRTSDNWSTSIENEVKAKYVGLENPGCICYLNSLLQQLFMTKTFRNAISSLNLKEQEGESKLELLKSLKELFFNLLYSEEIALNPTFFTKTIKSHDNKPLIKIFVQMDIDEFCSILFDKIEHQLNFIPNQPNIVKDIFGGIYAHQIISKECKHCSEREEQFISIGLEVKKNIQESFNSLIKGEMLDGENKYYCEKCDKKVKAEKILTIKKLPQNLILTLKRFEYNYEIDAKIKMNDYCEFPMELNLKKYSQQEINKANTPQNIEFSEENPEPINEELPDSYFMYKLKGVVVHTGSADSGHYYSFIEDADKNWFEFNDSNVTPFDVKNLPEEAFGSKDAYEDKVKNAYLLFYERVEQGSVGEVSNEAVSEANNSIIHEIIDKNKTISKFRLLFSKDYSDFASYLFGAAARLDLTLQEQEEWFRYIVSYHLLIKIREGSVDDVIPAFSKISALVQTNKRFSEFLFNSLVNFNFIEEVFVYSSNRDKAKVIAKLLIKTFINYYSELPQNFNALKGTQVEHLLNYIRALTLIHGNIYELELFLQTIFDFSRSKNDFRLLRLLEHSFEQALLTNLLGFNIPKEEKEGAAKYRDELKNDRSATLGIAKNDGKKYLPAVTKLSWQLLQSFIEYLEGSITDEAQSEDTEELHPLTHINALLDKAAKGGNLNRVIHQSGTSKSVYRLYKVFKLTNRVEYLLEGIEKGLKDFESTKYRQLLLLLYFIVIDRETGLEVIKQSLGMLEKVHAINEKYFLEVNFLHQWIIKYCAVSPLFLKTLSENEEFLTIIINWIAGKAFPSAELIKKHKNPANERLLNRLHGILVSADPKDYQRKSKFLKRKFENILNKKFELNSPNIAWEKQCLDEFYPGGQTYYYEIVQKKWVVAKVVEDNFGYLKLVQQNSTQSTIWDDSERLYSYKELTKEDLDGSCSSEEEIVQERIETIEEEEDLYN